MLLFCKNGFHALIIDNTSLQLVQLVNCHNRCKIIRRLSTESFDNSNRRQAEVKQSKRTIFSRFSRYYLRSNDTI